MVQILDGRDISGVRGVIGFGSRIYYPDADRHVAIAESRGIILARREKSHSQRGGKNP